MHWRAMHWRAMHWRAMHWRAKAGPFSVARVLVEPLWPAVEPILEELVVFTHGGAR